MKYLVSGFFKRKLFSVFSSFIFTDKLHEAHLLSYLISVILSKGKMCTNGSNILLYVQFGLYHFLGPSMSLSLTEITNRETKY